MLLMTIMHLSMRSRSQVGPASSMDSMRLLVFVIGMLIIVHLMMAHILSMVSRLMSSNLTSMMRWLSHMLTILLMVSDSTHSAKPLLISMIILLLCNHSLFQLLLFLRFNSCLSCCFFILFSLIFSLIKHISNFSQVINFSVTSVKSVIFISALNDLISAFFFS